METKGNRSGVLRIRTMSLFFVVELLLEISKNTAQKKILKLWKYSGSKSSSLLLIGKEKLERSLRTFFNLG